LNRLAARQKVSFFGLANAIVASKRLLPEANFAITIRAVAAAYVAGARQWHSSKQHWPWKPTTASYGHSGDERVIMAVP